MPRRLTGTVYEASGKWYARTSIRGQRERILLSTCNDRESAALLEKFAERLREAKREDIALQLLDHAAALENEKFDDVRRAVDLIVQGKVVRTREGNAPTVRELGERWTSGELARQHCDHVKKKTICGARPWALRNVCAPGHWQYSNGQIDARVRGRGWKAERATHGGSVS